MPESDELNAAIGHIKYKVDSMDRTLERLLRVNGKAMIADYMEQFAADPILAKVYLSVDGYKTQKAIGEDKVIMCRPADLLEPEIGMIKKEYSDIAKTEEDVLSCAMFPQVAPEFIKKRDGLDVHEIVVEWVH